jgi:hypothetical protein
MRTLVILFALGILPSVTLAQNRFPPESGTRVRISSPRFFLHQETGTVNGSDRYGLEVNLEEDGEDVHVPYADIGRLEVSRGTQRMTWVGALGGAALGMLVGAVTTATPATGPDDAFSSPSEPDPFPRMVMGALVGGFAGGLLGSTVEMETWEPVFAFRHRFP